jgi:hypothetical protein
LAKRSTVMGETPRRIAVSCLEYAKRSFDKLRFFMISQEYQR